MVGLSRPRVRREKILGLAVVLVALLGSTTVAAERFKEVVVYKPEHDGEWKLNCSREKSRMVRKVLNELIFPHMARAKANFTMSCPLAPQRDLYYEHEIHKQKFRSSYWKSLYSNKIFKSEFFIDQHMENRHMDKIPPTADVCLGETCSVFLCDAYALDHYEQMGRNLRMKSQFARKPCEAGAMASAQSECRGLLDACFGDLDPKLFVFFKRNVCDMLTCRDFHRLLPNLNAKRPNRYRVLYITFSVVLLLLLLSYYLVVAFSWLERKQRPDLRRRRPKPKAY